MPSQKEPLYRPRSAFGAALKEARAARSLGLREFCRRSGLDPALVSRIERGLAPPPEAAATFNRIARGLRLSLSSTKWRELADLAILSRGKVPKDLLDNEAVAAKLPVLFRALRDLRSDQKLLQELVEILRKA